MYNVYGYYYCSLLNNSALRKVYEKGGMLWHSKVNIGEVSRPVGASIEPTRACEIVFKIIDLQAALLLASGYFLIH